MRAAASPRCLTGIPTEHTQTWLCLPRPTAPGPHVADSSGHVLQGPARPLLTPHTEAGSKAYWLCLQTAPSRGPLSATSPPPPWPTRRCTWTSLLCPRPTHPRSHRPPAALHPNRTPRPRGLCRPFPCPRLSAQLCVGLTCALLRVCSDATQGTKLDHPGSPTSPPLHFPHDSASAILYAD